MNLKESPKIPTMYGTLLTDYCSGYSSNGTLVKIFSAYSINGPQGAITVLTTIPI